MSSTAIFVSGIVGSGVLTAIAIYAIAVHRGPFAGSDTPPRNGPDDT